MMSPADQKTIPVPDTGHLARAMQLKGRLHDLKNDLKDEEYLIQRETDHRTGPIREKIRQVEEDLSWEVAAAVSSKEYEDGRLILVNTSRVTRRIRVQDFRDQRPELFLQLAEIPIGKAEALIGTAELNRLCDIEVGVPSWDVTTRSKLRGKTAEGWYR